MIKTRDWVSGFVGGLIIIVGYSIVCSIDKIYDWIEKKEDE